MHARDLQQAADLLWTLWAHREHVDALPLNCRPSSLQDAWEIQRALDARAGADIGWKIAATSPAGQRHIRADGPLLGRLYEHVQIPTGATLPSSHLTMRTAEAEFAFRLATDLDLAVEDITSERVTDAIESLHLAIEIPDSRFLDFSSVGLPSLLADALCAGYLVVGPAVVDWTPEDLPNHSVTMLNNGVQVSEGTGANVLGDPCHALAWAAQQLIERGTPLRAGDLVTTGAATIPNPISTNDRLVADFGPYGHVAVELAS